jgi:hypothetical protein
MLSAFGAVRILFHMEASPLQETVVSPAAPSETTPGNYCERCGTANAVKVGARWLCENCYVEAGSCCPEFGADDLWDFDETKPAQIGKDGL